MDDELDALVDRAGASRNRDLERAARRARESGSELLEDGRDDAYYVEKVTEFGEHLEGIGRFCERPIGPPTAVSPASTAARGS
jgi:hypothetical protein